MGSVCWVAPGGSPSANEAGCPNSHHMSPLDRHFTSLHCAALRCGCRHLEEKRAKEEAEAAERKKAQQAQRAQQPKAQKQQPAGAASGGKHKGKRKAKD